MSASTWVISHYKCQILGQTLWWSTLRVLKSWSVCHCCIQLAIVKLTFISNNIVFVQLGSAHIQINSVCCRIIFFSGHRSIHLHVSILGQLWWVASWFWWNSSRGVHNYSVSAEYLISMQMHWFLMYYFFSFSSSSIRRALRESPHNQVIFFFYYIFFLADV